MAEFLNPAVGAQLAPKSPSMGDGVGFDAYGKPVPYYRRSEAVRHLRQMMGKKFDLERAMATIDAMCNHIQRDEPYDAMQIAMRTIDLTGTYRLLAVLLCAEEHCQ